MADFIRIDRRIFLARLGKGTLALAVLGACSDQSASTTSRPAPTTTAPAATSAAPTTGSTAPNTDTTPPSGSARFVRVNLGFVSAYIVVRGAEAAVVDTGVGGSEGAIETALGSVDLDWNAVGHVVLTHQHPDHVGSLSAVLTSAPQAAGYIGAEDLPNVSSPRKLSPLADGDEIFGLEVIHTPGHTAGHICLLDPVAAVLVAGDALTGANPGVAGPQEQFSADHAQALQSVQKLAGFEFETAYFGHGEPVLEEAGDLVETLAEDL